VRASNVRVGDMFIDCIISISYLFLHLQICPSIAFRDFEFSMHGMCKTHIANLSLLSFIASGAC
jgi:hypothetical protein